MPNVTTEDRVADAITFVLQQVVVPVTSMLIPMVIAYLVSSSIDEHHWPGQVMEFLLYTLPCGCGFLLGRVARALNESFRRSGRWIWILPSWVFAMALISCLFSDLEELPGLFIARGGENEEGLLLLLVTLPTASCCFYALGIRGRGTNAKGA